MSKIFRDSSVLNQFGSPSINSNTLSNRPTYGQPGRLFVSTDTLAIYRDTGIAWDNLTAGGGSVGTLQQVTTLGNRTNQKIFIGPTLVTPTANDLDVYGYAVIRNTVNSTTGLSPIFYSQYTINYNGTFLSGFANSIFAQDIYNVSASTTVASSTQSGTSLNINTYKFSAVSTITFTQPGGTIRAASALTAYSQFQNTAAGTITHAAGIAILGIENIGGSALTIDNNYQLLINASNEFASTATITNRWGIYQGGANDNNYFGGTVNINNTVPNTSKLNVIGTSQLISTTTSGTSLIFGNSAFQWNFNTSIFQAILSLGFGSNNVLNIGYDAPDGLIRIYNAGNIDFATSYFSVGGEPNSPELSAIVDFKSTTKGFLTPRMTTAQINAISTPATGLQIYNTTLQQPCFYDGTGWRKVTHTNM